jgi:hypothetical protein
MAECILLAQSGCVPAERRAEEHQSRVQLGMTQEEVRRVLGSGDPWWSQEGEEGDTWHYAYGRAPDPAKIAREVAVVTLLLVLTVGIALLISYGGGTLPDSTPSGSGSPLIEESTGRIHYFVSFDSAGRVRRISGMSPCHDP